MPNNRHYAIKLAQQGYRVLPLEGKRPTLDDWPSRATSSYDDIGSMWDLQPDANIGIATGQGLVVLDVDPRNGGDESLAKLERKLGPLPEPTVLTGGGGRHWYFRTDHDFGCGKLLPGVDVKGHGGQVVAPPSIHPESGRAYGFVNGSLSVAIPERLGEYIGKHLRSNGVAADDRTSEIPPLSTFLSLGNRNDTLTSMAGWMRRQGASEHEIATALIALAKESGLPVREARRTAASIARKPSGLEEDITKVVRSLDVRDAAYARRRARDVVRVELPEESLRDVLARPRDATTFTVHSLHPTGGNTLFIAQRKTGKTTIAMNLVKALADDEPFLNEFEVVSEGRVGYLNYELNEGQCLDWFEDMKILNQGVISVLNLRGNGGCLWIEENRKKFVTWLKRHKVDKLVIDPAGRAWRGVVDNENDNSQLREFTSILDEIKQEAGVSDLWLIHHIGKSHTEEGSERGRGGSALEDWPDAIWTLTKDSNGTRSFGAEGRDVDLEPHDLDYDRDTRQLAMCGARRERRVQDRVLGESARRTVELHQICKIVKSLGGSASRVDVGLRASWGDKKNRQLVVQAEAEGLISIALGKRDSVIVELTEDGKKVANS